ncbi:MULTISPECIES: SDR family oxidoreductase [unclassified Gordonia (in: high G+C Gram-positive bacteria)]|uniref:SDR family NAD(P)-dependent oxidoreductase n=1 Tax=unclassified Gordonia (in: high G+C Gram-positive bacteria) TaxID=2657482 RepID=UPI001F05E604|nr:SDR family oxidoreductase [Gordonia sp. PDNC005]
MSDVVVFRHAVVTGGASGIGAAVVSRLRDRGLAVTVFDRADPSDPQDGVQYLSVDVTDRAAVESAMAACSAGQPTPDVLVTSHGIRGEFLPAVDLDPDTFRRVFDVHVTGTLLVATAFARPLLAARRPGAIVTLSSTTAYGGWAKQADYGTAKAAVEQLSRNLAIEWAPHIRVNSVAPGHTLTPMVQEMIDQGYDVSEVEARSPLGRLCRPEEMARSIEHLALDATFVTGVAMPVDGGWTAVGR